MNKTNNNNPFSFGEGRGEAFYVAPSIEVIKNVYNEGLMQTWSTGVGTTPPTGVEPGAKENTWGNVWAEPEVSDDTCKM